MNPLPSIGVALLSLIANIVLMVLKIAVGMAGNSYALIADGIESAGDVFTSLITWGGFYLSLRPFDQSHPYGYGKCESLAGLFSATMLLLAAGTIAWNAAHEILTPHHSPEWFTLPVLISVVIVKWLVSQKVKALGDSMDSRALEGDAWHHISDALTSGMAAVGISIALIGGDKYVMADDWAALAACVIIWINGCIIFRKSLHDLLDGKVSDAVAQEICNRAMKVSGVADVEKCRIRKSGVGLFVELHLEVDENMTVRRGHEVGHEVKNLLRRLKPEILDVVVHLEPHRRVNPVTNCHETRFPHFPFKIPP